MMERIRDTNRQEIGRKKQTSDSGDPMKERNQRRKLQEIPPVTGNVRFYVPSENMKTELLNKIDKCKLLLSDKISTVSNTKILNEVFDFYLKKHGVSENVGNGYATNCNFQPYLACNREQSDENMFIVTESWRNMARRVV